MKNQEKICVALLKGRSFEDGWLGGEPPGITADTWPRSAQYGLPMRHIWTTKIPDLLKVKKKEYVAFSIFCTDYHNVKNHLDDCKNDSATPPNLKDHSDPKCLDRIQDNESSENCELAIYWHTNKSFTSEGCEAPRCCSNTSAEHRLFLTHGDSYLLEGKKRKRPIKLEFIEKPKFEDDDELWDWFNSEDFLDWWDINKEIFRIGNFNFTKNSVVELFFEGEPHGLTSANLLNLNSKKHYYHNDIIDLFNPY